MDDYGTRTSLSVNSTKYRFELTFSATETYFIHLLTTLAIIRQRIRTRLSSPTLHKQIPFFLQTEMCSFYFALRMKSTLRLTRSFYNIFTLLRRSSIILTAQTILTKFDEELYTSTAKRSSTSTPLSDHPGPFQMVWSHPAPHIC